MDEANMTYMAVQKELKCDENLLRILFEALMICTGEKLNMLKALKDGFEGESSKAFDKLQQLMVDPELLEKTIFDFDFSNPDDSLYKYHMLLAVNSLKMLKSLSKRDVEFFLKRMPVFIGDEKKRGIVGDFFHRLVSILALSGLSILWAEPNPEEAVRDEIIRVVRVGKGAFPFGSLLNHSCIPNIIRIPVDNKYAFIVQQPILKGQQLTVRYA